jgi:hypothetical protein
MMQAIKNWKPDYSKALCRFLSGQIKLYWEGMVQLFFSSCKNLFRQRAVVSKHLQMKQETFYKL